MFIKRKILPTLEKYLRSPEALILTGFRRTGKSTLITHLFDNLKTQNKLFLDIESPVNQKMFQEKNYDAIVTKFEALGLNIKKDQPYVFMDEIQFIPEIPSIVKYLFDHYHIKFILTGSSSFYLKNLFTESLSGRKFLFELLPLDFEEFLWFKGVSASIHADYDILRHWYDEFIAYGGLPGVVLETDRESKQLRLDDALGSYFQLDVVNLASFRDTNKLKSLLFLLSSRAGNKLDVTKLSESLGVSRQTLYTYLEFLEQTYLIHLVPAYSSSSDVTVRNISKLYFADSGILNRVGKVSLGHLFENTVFNQLYIKNSRISYFQKKSGAEIDFVVDNVGYEVKTAATSTDVKRLARFAAPLKLREYHVVSLEKAKQQTDAIIYPFSL